MRYGFVIDNRKCIGCHACTTACKSENEVPLGVFRTWVKYTEKGEFPNVRRNFNVMRCNHCEDAPCVTVCPTKALFKRPDGIVDFDSSRCIGCKSCMQACPYDAIYIDPFEHTAAKCNYCAHRVDLDLLPACVVVCPEKAIIAGDMDDPFSDISHLLATENVVTRKPEQGTKPKLFYIDSDDSSLVPEVQTRNTRYLWSEVRDDGRPAEAVTASVTRDAPAPTNLVYDVHHPKPWGWKVSTYLWTKSIGSGAVLLAALLLLFGWAHNHATFDIAAPIVGLFFIGLTTLLLVVDLKRPERFWFLIFLPNPTSWLVWGGYILLAFSGAIFIWLLAALLGLGTVQDVLMGVGIPLALAAAGYTAFLFAQAEGRDFWQSRLLLPHLIAQAVVAGAAALMLVGISAGATEHELRVLTGVLAGGLIAFAIILAVELGMPHSQNLHVSKTVGLLTRGPYRGMLLLAVIFVGIVVPLALGLLTWQSSYVIFPASFGAGAALAGLWAYELIWVSAGQDIPLS
jgi:Fe-S-cluster-containing dehydrogenase component/formate-dependent nitrite reductase membrane component NrfD